MNSTYCLISCVFIPIRLIGNCVNLFLTQLHLQLGVQLVRKQAVQSLALADELVKNISPDCA